MRLSIPSLTPLWIAAALTAGACTDDTEPAPEPPQQLEISLRATIPPTSEVEYCRFVTVPETWITHDYVDFTAGSHHVLVYQTPYAAIPTQKTDGTAVDTSGVFDCSDGPTNGWEVTKLVGGSQNAGGDSMLAFPAGVGVKIGGVLLLNVHYRNGSDATLDTEVAVRFDTATAEEITTEGDLLFLYNPLITVPAGGTSRARWRCPVHRDITIANAQSHMHARGIGYEARVGDAAPFYVNAEWEGVPVQRYESLTVRAGEWLDYHCDYRNTTGRAVHQGPRTTDEMCMLIGSYYPADPRTSSCSDASGDRVGGEWIGQGTATCAETLTCLQTATDLASIGDCMLAASPAVSRPSSALALCFFYAQDPAAECAAEIQSCAAQ